jgi:hypothetical protein
VWAAAASALATDAWPTDPTTGLAGAGAHRCGASAGWLAALCTGLSGGNGASVAGAAAPGSETAAVAVGAGLAAGAGLDSAGCEATGGAEAFSAAAAGVSTGAARCIGSASGCAAEAAVDPEADGGSALVRDAGASGAVCAACEPTDLAGVGWAASAAVAGLASGETAAVELAGARTVAAGAICVSCGPTGLAGVGWAASTAGAGLAARDIAAVELSGGRIVASSAVGANADGSGGPSSLQTIQKAAPITAAPASASAEIFNGESPGRRIAPGRAPCPPPGRAPEAEARARYGATMAAVLLRPAESVSPDGRGGIISSGSVDSVPSPAPVGAGRAGAREDSTSCTSSASISAALTGWPPASARARNSWGRLSGAGLRTTLISPLLQRGSQSVRRASALLQNLRAGSP